MANTQIQFNLIASASSVAPVLVDRPGLDSPVSPASRQAPDSVNLPTSGTYTLTVSTTQAATNAYSFQLEQTTVTSLTLGTPTRARSPAAARRNSSPSQVASASALAIVLTDANANDENEVYVSLGTAPTRDRYQYRYTSTGASQTLALAAQPGTYYILVYNNLVTLPRQQLSRCSCRLESFVLTGLTPDEVGNTQADHACS